MDVEEMQQIAILIDRLGRDALAVGSSGMARALAELWFPDTNRPTCDAAARGELSDAKIIAIVGTTNSVTERQLDHLQNQQRAEILERSFCNGRRRAAQLADFVCLSPWLGCGQRSCAARADRVHQLSAAWHAAVEWRGHRTAFLRCDQYADD